MPSLLLSLPSGLLCYGPVLLHSSVVFGMAFGHTCLLLSGSRFLPLLASRAAASFGRFFYIFLTPLSGRAAVCHWPVLLRSCFLLVADFGHCFPCHVSTFCFGMVRAWIETILHVFETFCLLVGRSVRLSVVPSGPLSELCGRLECL